MMFSQNFLSSQRSAVGSTPVSTEQIVRNQDFRSLGRPSGLHYNEILKAVRNTYLVMLSPNIQLEADRNALSTFVKIAPNVSHDTASHLVEHGRTWRERIIGITIAAAMGPEFFYEEALSGLRRPYTYEVVPSFALLYLALRGLPISKMPPGFDSVDPDAANGEMGWGLSKVCQLLELTNFDPGEVSPVTGLHFHFYVEAFEWIGAQTHLDAML